MPVRLATPPTSTDLDQARRCAQGDEAAHAQLYEAQRKRVHLILFRLLGSNRDLEDLIQEAFAAIFRSLASYRGEASLNTWVDRIATRVAYRYLARGDGPSARLGLVTTPETDDLAVDEQLHLRDIATRLYRVLDRLAPSYRVAFALHVLDERSLAEVAVLTESSRVAVKSRVWRARNLVERRAHSDPVLREFLDQLRGGRS